jgi:type I restriction enzyme S subunit
MSELPMGWTSRPLQALGLPKTLNIDPSRYPDEVFELYSVPSFPTGSPEYVNGKEIGSTKQIVQAGDVLLCKINPHLVRVWGVSPRKNNRQIASGEWIVIRANPTELDKEYIRYAFIEPNFRNQFMETVAGVGGSLMRARPKAVAQIEIPLPPLDEQRRIVARLDALLAHPKRARAELAHVPGLVERQRQAVLEQAFSGELTREWREQTAASSSWSEFLLSEVAEVGTGATPKRGNPRFYNGGTIPWVTSGVVNETIVNQAEEFITQEALRETNCKIYPMGTLLVAMYGEGQTRGRVSILGINAATNQALAAIRVKEEGPAIRDFVLWLLRSQYLAIRQKAAGGVQPNLNLGIIKSILVPLPSRDEQREIIRCIESAFARIDSAATEAERVAALLDRLDQATLARAFRGEL